MTTRIYRVTNGGPNDRLVRASNPAQAIRHIAKPYKADVASQHDLIELLSLDPPTKVEDASAEDNAE